MEVDVTQVNFDIEAVKKVAAQLKANPPTEREVAADPKAFLAKHGVQISDDLQARINTALEAKAAGHQQAGIIHIDA